MLMLPHNYSPIIDSEKARYRILYVGDDVELLRALKRVLKWPDYHLVSCPHVDSAILFLEGDPRYDLLIFEIEVRGKSGLKLAHQTRSIEHRSHLPIVMVVPNDSEVGKGEQRRTRDVNKWVCKQDVSNCAEVIATLLALTRRCNPVLVSGTASS